MRTAFIALGLLAVSAVPTFAGTKTAVFAGGCFWCVESDFESVAGVKSAVSGFTGGKSSDPTYKKIGNHYEAVKITFDDSKVSYERLVNLFFRSIDATDDGGQFCDRGANYRTAIFALNPSQKATAEKVKAQIDASGKLPKKIVTPVLTAGKFTPAGEYHQNYYKSSKTVLTRFGPVSKKVAYKKYRQSCGRDAKVKSLWGADAPFAAKYVN